MQKVIFDVNFVSNFLKHFFFDKNLFKVKISSAIKSIQVRLMLTKGSGTCSVRYYDRLASTNRPLKVRLGLVWSGLFSLNWMVRFFGLVWLYKLVRLEKLI
jgi:hypothetical protein